MKHKVFFWLVLNDRVNTTGLLKRRNMFLEAYDCELCILQKKENLEHLFLNCVFARKCWALLGIQYPTTLHPRTAFTLFKKKLKVKFEMEIIIIMTWSIWTTRNEWICSNEDPTVDKCKANIKEFTLLLRRAKGKYFPNIKEFTLLFL